MIRKQLMKKVAAIDDERDLEHGIFIMLKYGWKFASDPLRPEHYLSFDTWKACNDAIKDARPCTCSECEQNKA